jgi:hypothetical protein
MQFLTKSLTHNIGQRYVLGKLPQILVHQCLVITAALSLVFQKQEWHR